MADLSTYAGLKAVIADYLGRDDLTAQIPTFVRLAEKRMERDVKTRVLERRAICDVEAGAAGVKLPAHRVDGEWNVFLAMRDIVWIAADGTVSNLLYVPVDDYKSQGTVSGHPKMYTIIGDDLFFIPKPDSAGKLELAYYAEIPPLSETQTCNPLLHVAPDLYLYASLLESVPFTRGSVPSDIWMQAYSEAVGKLNAKETHARFTSNLSMRPIRRV